MESLSSHVKVCPHRICAKCDFAFDENVEHNCIELLKNERNELRERAVLSSQLNTLHNDKIEELLETNNKLENEIFELKTKLKSIEELLQNKTNNNTTVDREVANNEYICDSIENIYFGTYKTTLKSFEVYQDQFKFIDLETNDSNEPFVDLILHFEHFKEIVYCNDPSLRIIMLKPKKRHLAHIEELVGLNITSYSNHKLNMEEFDICSFI